MNKIELYLNDKGNWIANHVGDAEIMELFGTTLIPTAFTKQTTREEVVRLISHLNPGKEVIVKCHYILK